MKKIFKNHIYLFLVVLFSLVFQGFSEARAMPDKVYSIQASSFQFQDKAMAQYSLLKGVIALGYEDIPLRVEYIAPFFAVRLGSFDNANQAKDLLGKIKRVVPGAIVVRCYLDSQRIVSSFNLPAQSELVAKDGPIQNKEAEVEGLELLPEAEQSKVPALTEQPDKNYTVLQKSFAEHDFPTPAAGPAYGSLSKNDSALSKTFLVAIASLLLLSVSVLCKKNKYRRASQAKQDYSADYVKLVMLKPAIVDYFTDNPPACFGDVARKVEELGGYSFDEASIKKFVKTLRTAL